MSRLKHTPEISANSMADIAFLLLIFFLVATTIQIDKGISLTLPKWSETQPIKPSGAYFYVILNNQGKIMIDHQEVPFENLKDRLKAFITSENAGKKTIYLKAGDDVIYDQYILTLNELKKGFSEIYDEYALAEYGQPFPSLSSHQQSVIRQKYPIRISEEYD